MAHQNLRHGKCWKLFLSHIKRMKPSDNKKQQITENIGLSVCEQRHQSEGKNKVVRRVSELRQTKTRFKYLS